MEFHNYFATLRNNFLDAMERMGISTYPFVHRKINVVFVRGLELAADTSLMSYAVFLRMFFSRCESESMQGTCAWWFFADSVFNWDRLKYWFWVEPGTRFYWIDRSCPGMNWSWWNWLAVGIYEELFERVWGINGVIWDAFLKPLRW